MRRSSKSVTALIVEGYSRRRYKANFVKYLVYAQSECDETIVHLDFLLETGSASNREEVEKLKDEYEALSKRINKLTQWAEDEFVPPKR